MSSVAFTLNLGKSVTIISGRLQPGPLRPRPGILGVARGEPESQGGGDLLPAGVPLPKGDSLLRQDRLGQERHVQQPRVQPRGRCPLEHEGQGESL